MQRAVNPHGNHSPPLSPRPSPQVKFGLDFGPALGGRYTARPVAAFLDPFIRDTLANAIVWPQRCACVCA